MMESLAKHGYVVKALNRAEAAMSDLLNEMPGLIGESNRLAESYKTGIILNRHIIAGRVYLRWRYRYSIQRSRKFLLLTSKEGSSYLKQFPLAHRKYLLELDRRCQILNYRYSVEFTKRTGLRKLLSYAKCVKSELLTRSSSH